MCRNEISEEFCLRLRPTRCTVNLIESRWMREYLVTSFKRKSERMCSFEYQSIERTISERRMGERENIDSFVYIPIETIRCIWSDFSNTDFYLSLSPFSSSRHYLFEDRTNDFSLVSCCYVKRRRTKHRVSFHPSSFHISHLIIWKEHDCSASVSLHWCCYSHRCRCSFDYRCFNHLLVFCYWKYSCRSLAGLYGKWMSADCRWTTRSFSDYSKSIESIDHYWSMHSLLFRLWSPSVLQLSSHFSVVSLETNPMRTIT